jgi:hypothetical protein
MDHLNMRKRAFLRWANDRLWYRWPFMLVPLVRRFKHKLGYYPNLFHPRSLNEKILHRMLFDRRKHLPMLAGKLESRDFVADRLGTDILIPQIGVIYALDDLAKIQFPSRFIMKGNHGSGMTYIHAVDTPPDLAHLEQLCHEWLSCDFAKYNREWCYKDVKQAVVIEELLTDAQGDIPKDYKFFCYDGTPRYIKVDSARFTAHTADLFDCEWNHIPGTTLSPNSEDLPIAPPRLSEMVAIAAALSHGIDFVRVDLYDDGRQVKFGELTNTPARGTELFTPRALDYALGKYWNLSTAELGGK